MSLDFWASLRRFVVKASNGPRRDRLFPHWFARSLAAVLVTFASYGQTVDVWLTTDDQKSLMKPQTAISFSASAPSNIPVIAFDESFAYQEIEGYGASFTDSSAYLMNEKIPPASLHQVMLSLFDHQQGIGVSFVRNPMGASDLSRFMYSYDDLAAGATDPNLTSFSIAHDQADIIPLVKQALAINPRLKIMANPWSPPGWMKTTGSMVGGTLLPTSYAPLANYFVKYIQAYQAAGIPIDYISVQNEPLYQPPDYPGLKIVDSEAATFLKNYLLPALAANHLNTRVLVYDHNWDTPSYPANVLSDPALASSRQIAGVAWHWYGGPPGAMSTLNAMYPAKGNYVTEASGGTWVSDEVKTDFETIIHTMRNWSRSYVKWGIALDQSRGPHTGGCGTCTPLITVDSSTGAVTYPVDYYTLGHFSKFVLPGATRVFSTNAEGIPTAAFVNRDRSRVLVAYNDSTIDRTFAVAWNGVTYQYTLPALAGATFVWNGSSAPVGPVAGQSAYEAGKRSTVDALSASPDTLRGAQIKTPVYMQSATAWPIQASSYHWLSNLQSESCSDTNGGYDLGYSSDGSWAGYQNVDFKSGVTGVSVRVASGGTGGSLEFHIDSPTGPLIATAQLPVTGGWQTWKTVTAPVSGASGVHNLYVVFKATGGSGGIANLNWFRFQ